MNPSRRAHDLRDEENRLLFAWLKRKGLGLSDLMRMSGAEIEEHRKRAEAARIPIPRTEEGYLYHGTSAARAARIRSEGLDPDKPGIWAKTGHGLHTTGRVFVADTVHAALFYAKEMSQTRPALLCMASATLMDRQPDPRDVDGSFFVERSVPATDIEIWTLKGWVPCQEPEQPHPTLEVSPGFGG